MNYYKQCCIKKNKMATMTWIPENLAKQDKLLKMKTDDGWEEGWIVDKVYHFRKDEESVLRDRDTYLNQRKVSDI